MGAITSANPSTQSSCEVAAGDTAVPVRAGEAAQVPVAVHDTLWFRIRGQLLALMAIYPAMIFPIWWAGLAQERHYDLASLGLMQTIQMGGILASSLLLLILGEQVHRGRLAAVCLTLMGLACLAITILSQKRDVLLAYGVMSVGAGAGMSLGAIYIGQSTNAERQFSIQMGLAALMASIGSAVFPHILARFGNVGVQVACAVPLLSAALVVATLPARTTSPTKSSPEMSAASTGPLGKRFISWPSAIAAMMFCGMLNRYCTGSSEGRNAPQINPVFGLYQLLVYTRYG